MADIYLYVPCNGTRYYTSPNVASSTFAIYGDTALPSKKSDGRIYTSYTNRSLNISNNTNNRLPWNYTVEWWQRSASTSTAVAMMLSAGVDTTKLQLQDRMSGTSLSLNFENRFGTMGQDTTMSDSISSFNNSDWTHFAYVLDYSNARAYYFVNGVYKYGKTIVTPATEPSQMYMLCVGGKSSNISSAEEFFQGDLSDVVIYSGIKYQENESFTPPTESPSTTGLIAYGQESYTYIPKIQLFYENNQYKIYKFGKGGKALPAPTPYVRIINRNGDILGSIEGKNIDRVDKKQGYIGIIATSPSDLYVVENSSGGGFNIAYTSAESDIVTTNGASILRGDGSIARYTYFVDSAHKSTDSRDISGAPTFKSIFEGNGQMLGGIGTDGIGYNIKSGSQIVTVGPTTVTWDKVSTEGYNSGMSYCYVLASDTSKNIYLFCISGDNYNPISLMSYNTNFIPSHGLIGTSMRYAGLFIADGKLYVVSSPSTNTFTTTLLDDTQIWVDCTTASGFGLALTSEGKLYTLSQDYTYAPVFEQLGSDTGWTKIAGGGMFSPAIKNGDLYRINFNYGNPPVVTATQLTFTGNYVDVAGSWYANNAIYPIIALENVPGI